MKNSAPYLFAALFTLCCAPTVKFFLTAVKAEDHKKGFWLKGLASLFFIAAGIAASQLCRDSHFARLAIGGLVLGLAGDELLALRFVRTDKAELCFGAGVAAFAAGHGLYILALLRRGATLLPVALPLTVIGLAAAGIYVMKHKADAGRLQIPGYIYMAVVVLMGGFACALAVKAPSVGTVLFALGGILFPVSDSILSVYSFGDDKRFKLNVLLHIAYYAAQLFIAWSLAFI